MTLSAFPYIGGKTSLVGWITDHLPHHKVYVEPFGGAAAVLLNKARSEVEVYNDLDSDVVQFFRVARERPDELREWCQRVPFSEKHHREWVDAFYNGERADDPVDRAGRFLFLRYSQYSAKYHGPSGFKRDILDVKPSKTWANVGSRIDAVCDRLMGVSIQDGPYERVIEDYDSPETVFYCDPPYLDKDLYRVEEMNHTDLEAVLADVEGYVLVSYTERPPDLYEGWTEVTRDVEHHAGARSGGTTSSATERLICNFDPWEEPGFTGVQAQLSGFER